MQKVSFFIVALCICITAADAAQPVHKPEVPKTKETCEARGGEWMFFPMGQFYFCSIASTDGGKRCDSSDDCEGDCRAVPNADKKTMHGECSARLVTLGGCPKFFEHGKVVTEPCV